MRVRQDVVTDEGQAGCCHSEEMRVRRDVVTDEGQARCCHSEMRVRRDVVIVR